MNESRKPASTALGGRSVGALIFALSLTACSSQVLAPEVPNGGQPNTDLACTLSTNCVSSQPGSELEPLRFNGSPAEAMLALKATLATFPEAKMLKAEGPLMAVVFTTPVGFQDLVDFRIDTPRQRINYRSRSRFGLYDFGKNRSRMEAFAQRFEQSRTALDPAGNEGGPLGRR